MADVSGTVRTRDERRRKRVPTSSCLLRETSTLFGQLCCVNVIIMNAGGMVRHRRVEPVIERPQLLT